MPLEFKGARHEHLNVRSQAGLFDVSHMSQIRIQGPGALASLEYLLSNNTRSLKEGEAQYSLMCNTHGGIVDDLIVYCLKKPSHYLLIANGSRLKQDMKWLLEHNPRGGGRIQNETRSHAIIALQGPKTDMILKHIFNAPPVLKKFNFCFCDFQKSAVLVSATGYTGEKGVEILADQHSALPLWRCILEEGKPHGCSPAGLAARDTLRLEMKYPLYGADLNEHTSPHSAGLSWAVQNPADFIGKQALKAGPSGVLKKWVGFQVKKLSGQPIGVPRKGQPIFAPSNIKDHLIGEVASGALSYSLGEMIGTGFIEQAFSRPGQLLKIKIHQNLVPAEVVVTPFIKK